MSSSTQPLDLGNLLGIRCALEAKKTSLLSKFGHIGTRPYSAPPPQLCYSGFPPTPSFGSERNCNWSTSRVQMDRVNRSFPSKLSADVMAAQLHTIANQRTCSTQHIGIFQKYFSYVIKLLIVLGTRR